MRIKQFKSCPRCGADLQPSMSFAGTPSRFWVECPDCNTYVNTCRPMAHQEALHRDPHRILGNFGGFGTGKTQTTQSEIHKHWMITPNANILVGANISQLYEATIQKEFHQDIPAAFVKKWEAQKQRMTLINGAVITYRPLYDPDNLRSSNLTLAAIVEASESKPEAFHTFKHRLRNTSATVPQVDDKGNIIYDITVTGDQIPRIAHDWRKIILESNPDAGYIRTDVLLNSDKIYKHGDIMDDYEQDAQSIDRKISSHVASTNVNPYLPKDYIETNSKNKPRWWIDRYLYSSFTYSEGLVYPMAAACIIRAREIPKHWKRIMAFDYGLMDLAGFLYGAIDPDEGVLHIYKESTTNDMNVEQLAKIFHEDTKDIGVGLWYTQPIIDPKNNKRDYNKKDLLTHFAEHNIYFQTGTISVNARILRLNTYFESGKIVIHDCCDNLITELKDYKFKDLTLNNNEKDRKPKDKNNHTINPLEWIVMELPADPKKLELAAYNARGMEIGKAIKSDPNKTTAWQLTDERDIIGLDEDTFGGFPDIF